MHFHNYCTYLLALFVWFQVIQCAHKSNQLSSNSKHSKENRQSMFKDATPLILPLSEKTINLLENVEKVLQNREVPYQEWKELTDLPDFEVDRLCLQIWNEIDLKVPLPEDSTPLCSAKKHNSPDGASNYYKVEYQYHINVEIPKSARHFKGDILRCNCNYITKNSYQQIIAVKNSKKWFFLFKFNLQQDYLILTWSVKRYLKIIGLVSYNPLARRFYDALGSYS